ncbi:MAG: Flp pilus assembly protein CpaB [Methylocystis sp.]|uniref:Flp pilus assembly protein CpaB n=1 Tax=Methylocystis sp. TaxID=1911079 RepID=UPI003DA4B4C2
MNRAQLIVLGIAVAAGGGAFMMMNGDEGQKAGVQVSATPVNLDQVLIATHDLSYGASLSGEDVKWQDWPKEAAPAGAILKSAEAKAPEELKGSYVRIPIAAGEPVRKERLVKGVSAGLMSTMLPSGKRAVAIDVSTNNTAGGFILPNDRVDVIRTFRDPAATQMTGGEMLSSEVVLTNVRVLAMGQTIEKKGTEPVVTGSTATLELTPRQAERIVLAQKTGQLTLMLRAITDAQQNAQSEEDASSDGDSLTVVKHGVAMNYRAK